MKELMYTDVEFFRSEDGVHARFYYKLGRDREQKVKVVFDPTLEWLKDFADENKPYELADGHAWSVLVDFDVARAAEPRIDAQLEEKGALTDDEISEIIEEVYAQYFPEAAKWMIFDSEHYLGTIDFHDKAEKVWRKKRGDV